MTLPLPTVPTTVYAANTEVKSADLNDYQTFMAAIRAVVQTDYFRRVSLTDNSPVFAFTDRNGRPRSYLGPEGYMMGPAIQKQYAWHPQRVADTVGPATPSLGAELYSDVPSADLTVGVLGPRNSAPKTASNRAYIQGKTATNLTDTAIIGGGTSAQGFLGNLDDTCVVMEWRMYLDTVGTNGCHVLGGFHDNPQTALFPGAVGADVFCMFQRRNAITNWEIIYADGTAGAVNVDTGVAATANTFYTFRIELHGKNTPVGVGAGDTVARFFIDGVETNEITGTLPEATSVLQPIFAMRMQSPTAPVNLNVSSWRLAWNETLDFVVPA